ncbi:hypothetical protein [Actinoallomurus sp. CA-142502]|uniref:hypothetical protein n=1 Tax=Actinoallomurus sp. CA-142502 TaxID=3239885 RepID=UPI003D89FEBC
MAVSENVTPTGSDGLTTAWHRTDRLRAWVVTALVVASAVVVYLDKVLLGLVATPMSRELHLAAADFGALASASYALFGVTCLIVGFTAQRVSPRRASARTGRSRRAPPPSRVSRPVRPRCPGEGRCSTGPSSAV